MRGLSLRGGSARVKIKKELKGVDEKGSAVRRGMTSKRFWVSIAPMKKYWRGIFSQEARVTESREAEVLGFPARILCTNEKMC